MQDNTHGNITTGASTDMKLNEKTSLNIQHLFVNMATHFPMLFIDIC